MTALLHKHPGQEGENPQSKGARLQSLRALKSGGVPMTC